MVFAIVLLGVLLLGAGNVFQKKGHVVRETKEGVARHPILGLCLNPFWLLGISCATAGTLLYDYALVNPHWNITVIQPLMALNPVFTGVLAYLILSERLTQANIQASVVVIIGVILLGVSAENVEVQFSEWATNSPLGVISVLTLPVFLMKNKEYRYAILAGVAFGLAAALLKASSYTIPVEQFDSIHSNVSGGWLSYLAQLISRYYVWMYGITFVAGFVFFQYGFANGHATVIVVYSAAIGMLLPVVIGFISFGESVGFLKIAGTVTILVGILFPVFKRDPEPIQH